MSSEFLTELESIFKEGENNFVGKYYAVGDKLRVSSNNQLDPITSFDIIMNKRGNLQVEQDYTFDPDDE